MPNKNLLQRIKSCKVYFKRHQRLFEIKDLIQIYEKHLVYLERKRKVEEIYQTKIQPQLTKGSEFAVKCLKLMNIKGLTDKRYPEREKNEKALQYFDKGISFSIKKNYELAIKYFRKAIIIDPKFVDAYNNLAIAYAESGNLEEARRNFIKAMELNTKEAVIYLNRIINYGKSGKTKEELEELARLSVEQIAVLPPALKEQMPVFPDDFITLEPKLRPIEFPSVSYVHVNIDKTLWIFTESFYQTLKDKSNFSTIDDVVKDIGVKNILNKTSNRITGKCSYKGEDTLVFKITQSSVDSINKGYKLFVKAYKDLTYIILPDEILKIQPISTDIDEIVITNLPPPLPKKVPLPLPYKTPNKDTQKE